MLFQQGLAHVQIFPELVNLLSIPLPEIREIVFIMVPVINIYSILFNIKVTRDSKSHFFSTVVNLNYITL